MQIVGADNDDLLTHVARDRQTETATNDVAEEIKQHIIEAPLMKAELLQQFETVNDAAPAAAAPDLRTAKLHGVDAIALEADVADCDRFTRKLLARRGFNDRRTGATAEQQRRRVALGVAADQQHFLALLRHHVGQVGEREALADAALAVDRDDLGFLGHLGGDRIGLDGRLFAQQMRRRIGDFVGGQESSIDAHECALQSRTILRQAGSPNAMG